MPRTPPRRSIGLALAALVAGLAPLAPAGCLDDHAGDESWTGPVIDDRNCVGCHQADYDATTTPVHRGQFPTTCADCHGTRAWQPASWGHPEAAFPIASGAHRMPCTDCHVAALGSPLDGQNTSCTGCHTGAHARALMDEHHREVAGYSWSTTNQHFCLQCHPDGINRDDARARFR